MPDETKEGGKHYQEWQTMHEMNEADKAVRTYVRGVNCAQSILATSGQDLGPDRTESLRTASGFGGGTGRMARTCGVVTGAFMVLGLKYGHTDPEAPMRRPSPQNWSGSSLGGSPYGTGPSFAGTFWSATSAPKESSTTAHESKKYVNTRNGCDTMKCLKCKHTWKRTKWTEYVSFLSTCPKCGSRAIMRY